jgi:hypothetical protein
MPGPGHALHRPEWGNSHFNRAAGSERLEQAKGMDRGSPKRFPLGFKPGVHRRQHPLQACLAERGCGQGTGVWAGAQSGALPGDRRQQPLRVNSSCRHRSDDSGCWDVPGSSSLTSCA